MTIAIDVGKVPIFGYFQQFANPDATQKLDLPGPDNEELFTVDIDSTGIYGFLQKLENFKEKRLVQAQQFNLFLEVFKTMKNSVQ